MARADDDITIAPGPQTPDTRRFATGSIVAGRYRLVALLGRGGMGEVYRAEDLTLDHPVALKFLPEGVAADDARLAQFHNELRIARQVSHKNVVRLYDLGEADGRRFLTMEYVDGEDLASLLRRIGRFPQDKALDVARQLCAGVAAAHERGVLHRDLKPANVMIDGEGNVRITDFGIATAAADTGAAIAGTPQYMAPEQLAGGAASIRTDLYALGLILFEIFTGRRAYDAKTLGELKSLHDTGTVTTPTSIVRDLDPAIERVILRCLDRDPDRRPVSALAVAAALPGGNPLADALAAGETPSPELLVAAAEADALPAGRGLAMLATIIIALAIYATVSPRATMAGLVALDKPPAVLQDRAQQVLRSFGYTDRPADTAEALTTAPDYPRWLVETDNSTHRWDPARLDAGPALIYWYRTSPRDLAPVRPASTVSSTDPPLAVTGMSLVILDTHGRLLEFHDVPPQHDPATGESPVPPWPRVFEAAGLDMSTFDAVTPEWTPRDFADTRAAWEGPSPTLAGVRLRVEAAAYHGRVVSAYVIGPWSRAARMEPLAQSTLDRILSTFSTLLWTSLLLGAVLLARYNMQANRADRRSAARIATLLLVVQAAAFLVGAHHVTSVVAEWTLFYKVFALALLQSAFVWVLYLALEPYGRRIWPDGLLGWTRLFSGRLRDPRIGREVLFGVALGCGLMLIDLFRSLAPRLFGRPSGIPSLGFDAASLLGPGFLMLQWAQQFYNSVQTALIIVMLLVVLKLIVRHTWIAALVSTLVVSAAAGANMPPGGVLWIDAIAQIVAIGFITFVIFRFGLLVTTITLLVDNLPTAIPFTSQAGWAATPGRLAIALVIGLAAFGFYAARAGQPLLGAIE